jgi:hypothetical protein
MRWYAWLTASTKRVLREIVTKDFAQPQQGVDAVVVAAGSTIVRILSLRDREHQSRCRGRRYR